MTFEIFDAVLAFAIFGFAQVLYDRGACRFRPFEMRIGIVDE